MSVPTSVEELLQLIRKSGMIEEQTLNSYIQRRQTGRGLPEDPREAAESMVTDGLITNFQAEQFLLGKWRGFTIGKYKLLERIGVGGMGQVFLCEHLYMKRRVAIKVLPPAKAEQPAALGRFYREARAAGSLEHPNIVRTHDIDQDGNLHFIVMEYVDGSNLLDMVKKHGPMPIGRAAYYIRQVAIGLDFAFKNGIIHRDIKPGNILIDRSGTAKILDMGLARFYKDQTDLLTVKYDDKIVLGTADYVAPEQVANSHNVDVRADIYALGASLYFLLAGHPAFPSGTVSQKLLWHRTKDPTPIRQIRPEIPEGLAAIITKMMVKDPAKRFQTPMDVAEALKPWVEEASATPSAEEMPTLSLAAQSTHDSVPIESLPPISKRVSQLRSEIEADTPVPLSVQLPPLGVGMQVGRAGFASQPAPAPVVSRLGPKTTNIPRSSLPTASVGMPPFTASSPGSPAPTLTPPTDSRNPGTPPIFAANPFAAPAARPSRDTSPGTPESSRPDPKTYDERLAARVVPPSPDDEGVLTTIFGGPSNSKMTIFSVLIGLCLMVTLGLLAIRFLF